MKGQSVVVQFILFFLIGLSILISVGQFFKYQSDLFKERASDESIKLTSSYVSSLIITLHDSCKECDFINFTFRISNTTATYYQEVGLVKNPQNLVVRKIPSETIVNSSIHNLNETLEFVVSNASSVYPITLTFNKTKVIL